jgi:hypothetical protein
MAAFTLEEIAQARQALKGALLGVAIGGQECSFAGRDIRRMTAKEIRESLEWLDQEEAKLRGCGGPVFIPGIPRRGAW